MFRALFYIKVYCQHYAGEPADNLPPTEGFFNIFA